VAAGAEAVDRADSGNYETAPAGGEHRRCFGDAYRRRPARDRARLCGNKDARGAVAAAVLRHGRPLRFWREGDHMRLFPAIGIAVSMFAAEGQSQTGGEQERIQITRSGAPRPGPADNFTGAARIDSSFQSNTPVPMSGAR